jgi:hypothetical protein
MPVTLPGGKADVRAKMDALFGPIPANLQPSEVTALNQARDQLAETISQLGQYVKINATVNSTVTPGIHVTTVGGPTTQTGATDAPGSATGTII